MNNDIFNINKDELIHNLKDLEKYIRNYNNDINKKESAIRIRNTITTLDNLTNILKNDLINLKNTYSYIDYFDNDLDKTFSIILDNANRDNSKYLIKKYTVEYFSRINNNKGEDNLEKFYGNKFIIGEKIILDKIDDNKTYKNYEFYQIMKNIVNNEHSIIIYSNFYDRYDFINDLETNCYQLVNESIIKVNNKINPNIVCYTFKDELGYSLNLFLEYLKEYGGDIRDIPKDTIENRLQSKILKKEI